MHADDFEPLLFRLAEVADALTLPVWQHGAMDIETKPDGSPVTSTDVAVENEIRALVREVFPDDGFCGEEVGETPGQSGRTWIVDGIDGTRAFTQRRPEWSTLIALVADDEPVGGIVTSPALERRWYSAHDCEARVVHAGRPSERLAVSSQSLLADARIARWPSSGKVKPPFRDQAARLNGITAEQPQRRPSWDSHAPNGAMLVADGRVDAFVMFGGQAWDHAANAAVLAAAGGRFSCLEGTTSLRAGSGVYSNGTIHDELVAQLNHGAA